MSTIFLSVAFGVFIGFWIGIYTAGYCLGSLISKKDIINGEADNRRT